MTLDVADGHCSGLYFFLIPSAGGVQHQSPHNNSSKTRYIYTFHMIEGSKGVKYDERNWCVKLLPHSPTMSADQANCATQAAACSGVAVRKTARMTTDGSGWAILAARMRARRW